MPCTHYERPVFVVGAARSGTTLIQSLIAALPGFFSCPETHFFDGLMVRGPFCSGYQLHRPRLKSLPAKITEEHLLESLAKAGAGFLNVPELVREQLQGRARADLLTPQEYLGDLMGACTPSREDTRGRWVEKTPIHASYLEQIFEVFPDAQIVCVLRSPAGILGSAVSTFGVPVSVVALDYYRSYRDVRRFVERHPSRAMQVYFVSYDTITSSDGGLEGLLQFLDIDNIRIEELRLAAKENFLSLYEDSKMMSVQSKMTGRTSSGREKLSQWKLRAIDGYALLLRQMRLSVEDIPPTTPLGLWRNLLPVIVDTVRGVLYVAWWRGRCKICALKSNRPVC